MVLTRRLSISLKYELHFRRLVIVRGDGGSAEVPVLGRGEQKGYRLVMNNDFKATGKKELQRRLTDHTAVASFLKTESALVRSIRFEPPQSRTTGRSVQHDLHRYLGVDL
jgi:hypothetical protein